MTKAGDRILAGAREALAYACGEDVPGIIVHEPLGYRVEIVPAEGGALRASCPELPAAASVRGRNRTAVLQRVTGAIEAALAGMMRAGEAIRRPIASEANVVGPGEAFVFVSMRTADQVRAGWAEREKVNG